MRYKNKNLTVKVKVYSALAVVGALVIGTIVSITGMGAQRAAAAVPSNFVYRSGNKLMLNGSPYKFVGYNAFGMFGCEGSAWTRAQMDTYFAALPPASMTRIWAAHLYGTAMIDQAVASAAAHNQKLIMTLNNDTGDCVDDNAKTTSWYASGYKTGNYLTWVHDAVTKYKDSPAVGMWEVINEAGQTSNKQVLDGTTMKNFYQDVASRIKAIDPNHLVSTGDNGDNNYIGGATGFKTAGSAAAIDVLSLHDYASDYGAPGVMSPSYAGLKSAADSLSKPIIIGEINDKACSLSKTTRAANVKNSIDTYLANGAAGVAVWNFSQSYYNFCSQGGEDYIIVPSDPLYPIIKNYSIPGNVVTPPTTGGGTPTPTPAGCTVPANYGFVTNSITVPTAGTYRIWSRIMAPDTTSNSYSLDIDGASCIVVGDSASMPANAWTWVDYKAGSVNSTITANLTAGTHTFKVIGREAGVKVDRLLALSDQACIPASTGNNCTASADATAPVVTITAPSNGASVAGTASVAATATDNTAVTRVEFYVDNVVKTAATTAPYNYQWNTISLTNGTHTVSVKAYDAAGNVGAATTTVTVANGDVQAPSTPANVKAVADTYAKVTISWSASTDNTAVAGYTLTRNGVIVATVTNATTYADVTVAPNTQYSYQVVAYDATGNKSAASAAATAKTPQLPVQDTQAPTMPIGVLATAVSTSQINLKWVASSDNVGVTGYDVYRAAPASLPARVASVTSTQFGDTGLKSNTTYTYYVIAKDAAGNQSSRSVDVMATTAKPADQSQTGTLRGTVTGTGRKAISGATVTLWSSEGKQYTANTNASGVYRFDNLPVGYYAAYFHARGYRDQQVYPGIFSGSETVKNIHLTNQVKHPWWQIWK